MIKISENNSVFSYRHHQVQRRDQLESQKEQRVLDQNQDQVKLMKRKNQKVHR